MRLARAAVLGALSGCTLPPFEYEGEHVVVASSYRVCSGTLESFDRAVERIDQRLGLDAPDEPLRIAILDEADADRLNLCDTCKTYRNGPLAVVAPYDVESDATHEMGHVRVSTIDGNTVPLFSEGIAVAVAPALCVPNGTPPTLDTLLDVQTSWQLGKHGYYAGGELVAWLLDTHGPAQVLEFLGTLTRPKPQPVPASRSSCERAIGHTSGPSSMTTSSRTPGLSSS